MLSPGLMLPMESGTISEERGNTGSSDKYFVRAAAPNHLGIAGHNRNTGFFCGFGNRLYYECELFKGKSLFKNKREAQVERFSPADRKVIDRAVYRQLADVTAREKRRVNYVGIRGKKYCSASTGRSAESDSSARNLLLSRGINRSSISWCVALPPLPWARRITFESIVSAI